MVAVLDNNSHKFRFLAWLRLRDSTRQKLQKKKKGAHRKPQTPDLKEVLGLRGPRVLQDRGPGRLNFSET